MERSRRNFSEFSKSISSHGGGGGGGGEGRGGVASSNDGPRDVKRQRGPTRSLFGPRPVLEQDTAKVAWTKFITSLGQEKTPATLTPEASTTTAAPKSSAGTPAQ